MYSTTRIKCKFSAEYANDQKLQQDHPCVLELIRQLYLNEPASLNLPLNLKYPLVKDQSAGQAKAVQRILRNLVIVHFFFYWS